MRLSSKLVVCLAVGVLVTVAVPDVSAQMARISGVVVDTSGQPIPGATLTVTTPDSENFKLVKTSNKKGKATLAFSNFEWQYQLKIEKEGYQTRTEPLQLTTGGTMTAQWTLLPKGGETAADADTGGGDGGGGSRAVRTYNEGVEAQRLGDLDLAAQKYRAAAEMAPDLATPHTALSAVAMLQEDYGTAAAEAEAALGIDPEDTRALQLRFDAYRLAGDEAKAEEAAKALREIGDLDQAAGRIFNEGVDAFQAGDTATAISKFQQAVQLDPELVNAYVALAQMNLTQGAPAEAGAMADEALEREPDNVRAIKLRYDAARLTSDQETAAKMLDRLVELDPEWMGSVLFDHAGKLFNANQPAAAAFELEYVVKAKPDLARAHFMLGMAYFNTGKTKEGSEHLQKFIELTPDDPDVEIAKGLLSYEQ
jgi:tetratricopeptide (TPR) repeat protein